MKKKLKLKTVPDFVVRHVDKVLVDAKAGLGKVGGRVPALRYFRNGAEFSMPISYEYFVKIGHGMREMATATAYIQRMGPEFAFLATEFAERAENKLSRMEDKINFISHIGHVLYHVAPQAFFVTVPVRVFSEDDIEDMLGRFFGDAPQPPEPNAIVVTGCNQVRSYTVISPFSTGNDGRLRHGKPTVFDSLAGHRDDGALFTDIYEPSRN